METHFMGPVQLHTSSQPKSSTAAVVIAAGPCSHLHQQEQWVLACPRSSAAASAAAAPLSSRSGMSTQPSLVAPGTCGPDGSLLPPGTLHAPLVPGEGGCHRPGGGSSQQGPAAAAGQARLPTSRADTPRPGWTLEGWAAPPHASLLAARKPGSG
ncbi:hypothetical protein HaLaN_20603 [Haematococcus lacustris]|uniref:Uncharacterized protein n=1 Tax=Haematococcus lacustris TaxID=44745 RepID=A0A699ZLE4_HAELA|nr:hypothetical protein HaLaN_20603 [Haematococcus lacustris]